MKRFTQKGFSLVELLLVIVLIGTSVFLLGSMPNAIGLITKSNHLSLAREIATKQLEDKRALSYINLVPGTVDLTDNSEPRIALLPDGSGTVTVSDCDPLVDVAYCPNSEHIKIVTVTINWKNNNKAQTINLNTFIAEGGINQ